MAKLVYLLINARVFLNVGIGLRNVGLRLVVVVVGNKIVNGALRKKLFKFLIKLGGQHFVGGYDQRGQIHLFNHRCHRKSFAGTGNAQKHLVFLAGFQAGDKLFYRLHLISFWREL